LHGAIVNDEHKQIDERQIDGRAVIERLRELPGGPPLLELAEQREDVELIGGATRDLLLGRSPRELDVVVDGEAEAFGDQLASSIDGRLAADGVRCAVESHERFGTAVVSWPGGRIDVTARRAETYAAPGALPDVRAGSSEEDLNRRDFTVNAIAVALGGARRGELRSAPDALADLAAGRLRVLHERSFIDDPTRLLRLARYSARLRFEPEPLTACLAAEAVAGGALDTVSGARIGAELRLALGEANAVATLATMDGLGLLAALCPRLGFRAELAHEALSLLPEDARPDLLLLATLLQPMLVGCRESDEDAAYDLLDALEFPAADRNHVLRAAICADAVAEELEHAEVPSNLYEASSHVSLEGVALAGAWGELEQGPFSEARASAREWLDELRHVRLRITGDDLLAAGVAPGPEIGRRLECALRRKLDGELEPGREAELSAALES
jgi:tRNA nucleotidyltransferase (CCA-adding enzyme)